MKKNLVAVLTVLTGCAFTACAQTNAVTMKLDPDTLKLLQSLNEDHWLRKDVMVSTIVGGALAIIGGFLAALYTDWLQAKQKRRDDDQFSQNVLRAIRRELEAIGEVYDHGIGEQLKQLPEGQIFPFRLGLTQDWFTIFHANAVHLGRLEGEICRQVVTVYMMAQQLIEELRLNNDGLYILGNLTTESKVQPFDPSIPTRIAVVEAELVNRATNLKKIAEGLKVTNTDLLARLDERGIK